MISREFNLSKSKSRSIQLSPFLFNSRLLIYLLEKLDRRGPISLIKIRAPKTKEIEINKKEKEKYHQGVQYIYKFEFHLISITIENQYKRLRLILSRNDFTL